MLDLAPRALVLVILLLAATPAAADEAPDGARIDALVRQLGDPDFARREAATRALKALGRAAEPAIRRGLRSADGEIRARCARLLGPDPDPLLAGLGAGTRATRERAVAGIARLARDRRRALLLRGLFHTDTNVARACARTLSWEELDQRELERMISLLLPRFRVESEPIAGLEQLLSHDNALWELRRTLGFEHVGVLLARFPERWAPPDPDHVPATPRTVFGQLHRRLWADHVPHLLRLTQRPETALAEAALDQALSISLTTGRRCAEVAALLCRRPTCLCDRATPGAAAPGVAGPAGLPPAFTRLARRFAACPECNRKAAAQGTWVDALLYSWGRRLTPGRADLPLLARLASRRHVPLARWAAHQLGRWDDPRSRRALAGRMQPAVPVQVRRVAAAALARLGDADALARLRAMAQAAREDDGEALALLWSVDEAAARALLQPAWILRIGTEDLLTAVRHVRLQLGAVGPEAILELAAERLLTHPGTPLGELEELLPRLWGGPQARGARTLIARLTAARTLSSAPSYLGFLEVHAGRPALRALLETLGAPGGLAAEAERAQVEALRRRLQGRTTRPAPPADDATRWDALAVRMRGGDAAATRELMTAVRRGYYDLWGRLDLEALPWTLEDVPRALRWGTAICCTRIDATSVWQGLFGALAIEDDTDRWKTVPLEDWMRDFWTTNRTRLVRSELGRCWVVGPARPAGD